MQRQPVMDMSFLHSYKPVLYPVTAAMFDEQCLDEKSEESAVVSLVALCCQKIVQVRRLLCILLEFVIVVISRNLPKL